MAEIAEKFQKHGKKVNRISIMAVVELMGNTLIMSVMLYMISFIHKPKSSDNFTIVWINKTSIIDKK